MRHCGSVVVGVSCKLCSSVFIVMWWAEMCVSASNLGRFKEEVFDISCFKLCEAIVDLCFDGCVISFGFRSWR